MLFRSKYTGGLPGPGGNVSLNGDNLIQQAQAEIETLNKELDDIYTGGDGYSFIIG